MFGPFFCPFLGTVVKSTKQKKVAPGIYLHLYIIDGVFVCLSVTNSEDRPEGPLWGP